MLTQLLFGITSVACATPSFAQTPSANVGPMALFAPIEVKGANFLLDGTLTKLYRGQMANVSATVEATNFRPVRICFTNKGCSIKEKAFVKAVLETIKKVEGKNVCFEDKERTIKVIKYIYRACNHHKGTLLDLINFTAIALHNMYSFTKFVAVDVNSTQIGFECRGLLQIKSKKYYKMISKISKYNFVKKPYNLNKFCFSSIKAEFGLFLKYFSNFRCGKKELIGKIVKRFSSDDSKLLDKKGCIKKLDHTEDPELVKQLKRRIKIFRCLYYLLNSSKRKGSSKRR